MPSQTKHHDASFLLQSCARRGNPAPPLRKNQAALQFIRCALTKIPSPLTQVAQTYCQTADFPLDNFQKCAMLTFVRNCASDLSEAFLLLVPFSKASLPRFAPLLAPGRISSC